MHDARLLDQLPAGAQRAEAPHWRVWIRHAGAWRKGGLHCWFVIEGQWIAWLQHDDPDPDRPWAVWGLYIHDGTTIRRRHHPAAVAHVEDYTPEMTTHLRDLGYAVLPAGDVAGALHLG